MRTVPDRNTFETAYTGQAPWDIGRPQKAFLGVADRIAGSVLDPGCGTGDNALFFASRGHKVTGIDFASGMTTRTGGRSFRSGMGPN
jgi:SAM-dependent methyltransferase